MGKKYIYIRVSTEKQDFAQQMECIRSYFARIGIDPASIDDIVKEKASGTIDAIERKLSDLLNICTSGDTIFTSEISRLSRTVSDTNKIVDLCCKRDISLIQCKDGVLIENNTDYIVFKNWWSSGRYFTWTKSNNMWKVGCFYGTGKELIEKAYKDSELSGKEYKRVVDYVESILRDSK